MDGNPRRPAGARAPFGGVLTLISFSARPGPDHDRPAAPRGAPETERRMGTHWHNRVDRRELCFLLVLAALLFTLYSLLTLSSNRWTLHPDDHDVYVFSRVLLRTGHLWYESSYNEEFKTEAFQPALGRFESDGSDRYAVRALYSPGIYVVAAPGHLAGLRGPFLIVSALGVAGILFLYFFVKEIFDRSTAMVASVFLGFSAAYAYWSDMLFSNVPALAFFTGGLLFLSRAVSRPAKRTYYFLAATLFVLSAWMRYDYLLLAAVVAAVLLLAYRREIHWPFAAQSAAVIVALSLVFMTANFLMTGSVTGSKGVYGAGKASAGDIIGYFPRVSVGAIVTNAWMYLLLVAPALVVLGVLGGALLLARDRSGFAWILVLVPLVVLFFFGKGDGFWGYGRNWLASSYTRYFLPAFMCLAVLAAAFTMWAVRRVNREKAAAGLLALLLSAHLATSMCVLFKNQFGLEFTDRYNGNRKCVDAFFAGTQEEAVVVDLSSDDYFRFDIVSRTVLNPSYFPKEEAPARLACILERLRARGTPLYVINNPERSMLDVGRFEKRYNYISLDAIRHPVAFQYGSRTPDIYKVEIKR